MTYIDRQYERLLVRILNEGSANEDRTGTGTYSLFGAQLRFDLRGGTVPLLTTKKVAWKSMVAELLWFLSGNTNIKALTDQNVHIWDDWADENGDLGPVYSAQWRSWLDYDGGSIDQITRVIESLRANPSSRRHIVSAWNPAQVDDMALPPCHALFQFHVANGELSCQLYQRSADMFIGVPFNIASYALLTHLIAREVGLAPGDFIWTGGDCHIYSNHLDQVREQLSRSSRPYPTLDIKAGENVGLFDLRTEDLAVKNYNPHPPIKAPIAV